MHVAVLGEGALGAVYGVRLAQRGVRVTFVVRTPRTTPLVIERADGREPRMSLATPRRALSVPNDADLIVCAVRATDLDETVVDALTATERAVIVLTPILPAAWERLHTRLGARLLVAMPSVVSYTNDAGVVRYWLPRVATTLVEEPQPIDHAVDELVRELSAAGIRTRLDGDTRLVNWATTVTFLPLVFALDVAGSADALVGDGALVDLSLHAAREAAALAQTLGEGKMASWASVLLKFYGKTTLRIGLAMAKKRSPEGVAYVEAHFARKMHQQNVAMADEIASLAGRHGLPRQALTELRSRLERS